MQAHGAACAAVYELLRGAVALHARLAGFLGQLRAGGFLQCSLASLVAVRRSYTFAVRYIGLIGVAHGIAERTAPLTVQPTGPRALHCRLAGARTQGQMEAAAAGGGGGPGRAAAGTEATLNPVY